MTTEFRLLVQEGGFMSGARVLPLLAIQSIERAQIYHLEEALLRSVFSEATLCAPEPGRASLVVS
jgi:hypothetical protein